MESFSSIIYIDLKKILIELKLLHFHFHVPNIKKVGPVIKFHLDIKDKLH